MELGHKGGGTVWYVRLFVPEGVNPQGETNNNERRVTCFVKLIVKLVSGAIIYFLIKEGVLLVLYVKVADTRMLKLGGTAGV